MHPVYIRILAYVFSSMLALIPAAAAGWGVAYADGILSVHIETLATALGAATIGSLGVFRLWGTR
ncbi:MAG: hypothetical protein IPM60_15035 [Rhodospirillales bacterium]|nr:hypothetical protein [Rhodospirillales bacterium]